LLVLGLLIAAGCTKSGQQGGATAADETATADVAYINGKIYTVDEAQPWAEAVAIKDGRFLVVGSNEEVAALTDTGTEVIDLDGAMAMPGIGDTHIHPSLLMAKRAFCALPGTFYQPTEQDILAALDECIANYPDDREWFIAQGYSAEAGNLGAHVRGSRPVGRRHAPGQPHRCARGDPVALVGHGGEHHPRFPWEV